MKPITVVTLKKELGGPMTKYYASLSLHYALDNRPHTRWIKYEGVSLSKSGYQLSVFKFAC